jgi:hypothetical protein
MALGLAPGEANKILDAIARAVNYTAPVAFWIKLHIGDPGAAGATNPAGNTTRKQATFGSGAAGGAISNTAALTWTSGEVTTSEDYTHWSAWTASTAGTFLASGTVTANPVTAGDQFTIPIGDLDLTFNVAA